MNRYGLTGVFFAAAMLLAGHCAAAGAITVSDGWLRAMPPTARNSAGYLGIHNAGTRDDALVGARVEGARVTELHEMVRDGDTMAMRRRTAVDVPAGGSVSFAPGGLHLMLIDLQRPLRAGETREASLFFRDAGEVRVELEVRSP